MSDFKLITRSQIPDAIRAIYDLDEHAVGGCLHIVLDDFNVEPQHVAWCVDYARQRDCTPCYNLGLALLALPDDNARLAMLRAADAAPPEEDEQHGSD